MHSSYKLHIHRQKEISVIWFASTYANIARSHKSRAAVDYTPIGVEPHGPTRGV